MTRLNSSIFTLITDNHSLLIDLDFYNTKGAGGIGIIPGHPIIELFAGYLQAIIVLSDRIAQQFYSNLFSLCVDYTQLYNTLTNVLYFP